MGGVPAISLCVCVCVQILSPVVPGGGAAVGVEQNQLVQELGRPIMVCAWSGG